MSFLRLALICPACGIKVVSVLKQDTTIHEFCIKNGIINRKFKDYEGWLELCRWNYERVYGFSYYILNYTRSDV